MSLFHGKCLEITSNSPEVGNVHEEIVVETIEGEELKISFSSKYMMRSRKTRPIAQAYRHRACQLRGQRAADRGARLAGQSTS